jgi:glycosyltransferase involved in cell wall biosynthesis
LPAVHQFHHAIRRGDAIGEEMLAIRGRLRAAGWESEIFAGSIAPDLAGDVRPFDSYAGDPDNLLLVHHSIGHHLAGRVAALPDRELLVYHDITPPRFFAGDSLMVAHLERGLHQLDLFRSRVAGAIADSRYGARQLSRRGFMAPTVVPPVFAIERLPSSTGRPGETPLFLFVGRIAPNKRQDDVLEAFESFASAGGAGELALVGDVPEDPFARRLSERIRSSPCRDRVRLPGLVSDADLDAFYRRASLFLSMSEHEGFGVPLLESFAYGVPVLAFAAAAVPETMGGAGVLFTRKRPDEVAAMMAELCGESALRARVIEEQKARLGRPDLAQAGERLLEAVRTALRRPERAPSRSGRPLSVRIEGPFETSYGLAAANRALALALDAHAFVRTSIECTEGTGDYLPRSADLADKPRAARLWERSFAERKPDVVIRNLYPPRFERPAGRLNLSYFFWEDSLLPAGWGERLSRGFDAVLAPSEHVREVLRASGVTVPIEVLPPVVESETPVEEIAPARLPTARKTKFLSIGSAFPRKGTDVLISAFARAFSAADDVVLVLKTFPNVHNTVAETLENLRASRPDCPEILHIDRDMPREELLGLYRAADAFVHPARAEGFGLPAAEAMLFGVPVIAPDSTGLADFCNAETALLVPHRPAPSRSHVAVPAAEWSEPDEEALAAMLRGFADGSLRAQARRRAGNARRFVREHFSARAVAGRAQEIVERLWDERTRGLPMAVVSSWNTRCGIATYAGHVFGAFPSNRVEVTVLSNVDGAPFGADAGNVTRVWTKEAGGLANLVDEVLESGARAVHVQFHASFYASYRELKKALLDLAGRGIRLFVTFHMTHTNADGGLEQPIADLLPALTRCERLFVHHENDLARLAALGLENVALIPHGGVLFPRRDRTSVARALKIADRRVVATFGFALPHKGLFEAIEAVAVLRETYPTILFLAMGAATPEEKSREYLARCRARISELDLEKSVYLYDGFLREEEVGLLLSAAEAVVLPYHFTKESASGAIRYPLAAGRATVATRERIFDDVRDVVLTIDRATPAAIAGGIARILEEPELRQRLEIAARRFARARSWERAAQHYLAYYSGSPPPPEEPAQGEKDMELVKREEPPASDSEDSEYLRARVTELEADLEEAARREADARETLEITRRAAAAIVTDKQILQEQVDRYHRFITDLQASRLWRIAQAVRRIFGRAW